jgi:hypothetical protein
MKIRVDERIDAAADIAWPIVSDFSSLAGLAKPGMMVVDGSGVGAVRTLTDANGAKIQERLDSLDCAGRTFSYSVINDAMAPVPFTGYRATVTLCPLDANTCTIGWSGECEPRGMSEDELRPMIQEMYRAVIRFLQSKIASAQG